ncbi:M48 family metalloprotease [Motiliproteus sp. SC1-56]|uniref:M48 family metalloprotease n=1 Tax=Motiliproteus sp. SC1-56 TaxID=2799565 RepID=UPI001A8D0E1F|nr:M48 family metalloprotease [Motiliproteus sp. SC1-56]
MPFSTAFFSSHGGAAKPWLALTAALLVLTGCSTNPVTGAQELALVSKSQELDIGAQQYSPSRQAQGGDYQADPGVEAYVQAVGQRLAAVSDRDLPYEFRVINNSVPNAWALPGGKIAVNRGLLTELNSEAELAAVLGHEIVHAAARHGAQSMQRGLLLQGAVMGTVLATRNSDYGQLAALGAGIGSQLINTRYGRDAERESDRYGMQYMSRAGYDPQGAVELQETFVRLAGEQRNDWLQGLFASHPPSTERVQNNRTFAATLPAGGEVGRERYLEKTARLRKAKPAYQAYDEGRKALAEGNREQARRLANKALAIEPREAQFHALLGDIALAEDDFSTALGQYDKAISLNGNYFYYPLQRGRAHARLDHPDAARRDLELSLKLLPSAAALNILGDLARGSGDLERAKAYYTKAAGSDSPDGKAALNALLETDLPENPQNYLKLSGVQGRDGQWLLRLSNPTPRDVSLVVLELAYPDGRGGFNRREVRYEQPLPAGESRVLATGVNVAGAARDYRSRLLKAQLSR